MAKKLENEAELTLEDTKKLPKKLAINLLDILLGGDINKIELPTKKIEIKRLSKVFGAPFNVTIQAVSASKWEELQDMALNISGKDVDLDTGLLQTFVVMECVLDENGNHLFKNTELVKHFGVETPKELVRTLLLSGEIANIYAQVSDLSGFNNEAVSEVKN